MIKPFRMNCDPLVDCQTAHRLIVSSTFVRFCVTNSSTLENYDVPFDNHTESQRRFIDRSDLWRSPVANRFVEYEFRNKADDKGRKDKRPRQDTQCHLNETAAISEGSFHYSRRNVQSIDIFEDAEVTRYELARSLACETAFPFNNLPSDRALSCCNRTTRSRIH